MIELGSLALGRRDCNFMKADIFHYARAEKLEAQESQKKRELQERVEEGRKIAYSGLLYYQKKSASSACILASLSSRQ